MDIRHVVLTFWNMFQGCKFIYFLFILWVRFRYLVDVGGHIWLVVQTLNPMNETTSGLELNQPRNSFFQNIVEWGSWNMKKLVPNWTRGSINFWKVVLELKTKGSFKEILLQSENQTTMVSRNQCWFVLDFKRNLCSWFLTFFSF